MCFLSSVVWRAHFGRSPGVRVAPRVGQSSLGSVPGGEGRPTGGA